MKNTTVIVGILSALSILVCLSGSTAYAQLRQGELDLNKLHNYANQLVPKDINGNKKKPKDNSGDNHITDKGAREGGEESLVNPTCKSWKSHSPIFVGEPRRKQTKSRSQTGSTVLEHPRSHQLEFPAK